MSHATPWPDRLHDSRSTHVIFLSHCLLNTNTRYLGGATRPGVVLEVIQPCIDHGLGLVQLPCPEQHAWGGVLKHHLLRFYGASDTPLVRLRRLLLPLLLAYTRRVYRRLARDVAAQMQDYVRAGYTIRGIVGLDGSPSCGVLQRLEIDRALPRLAALDREQATSEDINAIVRESLVPGRGLFIECLEQELQRRGITVPWLSHSLIDELDGRIRPLSLTS